MDQPRLQISVAMLLALVACVALNIWLFRVSIFWGIIGLNVTKHVGIAYLCQFLGIDKGRTAGLPVPAAHPDAAPSAFVKPVGGRLD